MKKIFTIIPSCLLLFIIYRIFINRTQIKPYPYSFTHHPIVDPKILKADILIVGDRSAIGLEDQIGAIQSLKIKDSLKIFNWARKGEGLHRTLHKLKRLPTLPKIVIYMGASEEFFEKKFDLIDREIILDNFSLSSHEMIISLLQIWPILSRIIYTPIETISLNLLKERKISTVERQLMEVSFKIFESEFTDLLDYFYKKNNIPLIILGGIKLNIQPDLKCKTFQDPKLSIPLNKNSFKKKEITLLIEKYEKNPKDPVILHLVGKVFNYLNKPKRAKDYYLKSHLYDCTPRRGHFIFRTLMQKIAKDYNTITIDFHKIIQEQGTLQKDHSPTEKQMKELTKLLRTHITEIYNL